jgi:hypothetical protein
MVKPTRMNIGMVAMTNAAKIAPPLDSTGRQRRRARGR